MSEETSVSYEQDGPLGILTMHHAPHNLLGPLLMEGVRDALARAEREGARAVLLKSGLRHFSAGADIALFEGAMGGEGGLALSPVEFLIQRGKLLLFLWLALQQCGRFSRGKR